jgi:hypothetical protein
VETEVLNRRRALSFGLTQMGLLLMALLVIVMFALIGLGETYYGDHGAEIGAVSGVLLLIGLVVFIQREDNRIQRGDYD